MKMRERSEEDGSIISLRAPKTASIASVRSHARSLLARVPWTREHREQKEPSLGM